MEDEDAVFTLLGRSEQYIIKDNLSKPCGVGLEVHESRHAGSLILQSANEIPCLNTEPLSNLLSFYNRGTSTEDSRPRTIMILPSTERFVRTIQSILIVLNAQNTMCYGYFLMSIIYIIVWA